MKTKRETLAECGNCGITGKVWPTPNGQDLCARCWEDWFNKDEVETVSPRWVLQCPCGDVVKGVEIEASCACGRVYVCMQIY